MSAPSGTAPVEIDANERERLAVDGVQPRLFVAPESADDAARLLGWAAEERLAVAPRGGGTRASMGNIPRAFDMCLSTERLDKVLEYEPSDLTITVQSGIRFSELQRVLGERGQFLPLDPEADARLNGDREIRRLILKHFVQSLGGEAHITSAWYVTHAGAGSAAARSHC